MFGGTKESVVSGRSSCSLLTPWMLSKRRVGVSGGGRGISEVVCFG